MSQEQKPENPSSFPLTDGTSFCTDGMTLRDYFANSAMQGLLSNSTFNATLPKDSEDVARIAYKIADAMLKQREL